MTETGAAMSDGGKAIGMKFNGASPLLPAIGQEPLPGASSYFLGNDSTKWRSGVPRRSAEPTGASFWLAQLNSGMPPQDAANAFFLNAEHIGRF